jgi:hypothetical protein
MNDFHQQIDIPTNVSVSSTNQFNTIKNKKTSISATFKAVAWSFLGVRKGVDHESDMANLNPIYVILAGIISCAIFIFVLIAIVQYVVN